MLTQLLSFSIWKRNLGHWHDKCVVTKTKYEIMKHYRKDHIIFFIPNRRSWDFKPLLEKAKPTSVDSSSEKPKALIRIVCSQPLWGNMGRENVNDNNTVIFFGSIHTKYVPKKVLVSLSDKHCEQFWWTD